MWIRSIFDGILYHTVDPSALSLRGATQAEIYRGTVDDMVAALQADPDDFWKQTTLNDGPIEIWEIHGDRFLFNGNHRYQAALIAGVEIPASSVIIRQETGSRILTFPFDQMSWLPGHK